MTATMTNVKEADKLSQIIDDSIKTRNPTVLLEKIDSVCKEPQNLSQVQLALIRTMTVDSMLESDQRNNFEE